MRVEAHTSVKSINLFLKYNAIDSDASLLLEMISFPNMN